MELKLKRIYEASTPDDGYRVLVDRLWPRGIKKVITNVDLWVKDIAPSTELRKWFSHDINKWEEFRSRYKAELSSNPRFAEFKTQIANKPTVTLLFGAKDIAHNNAIVLKEVLEEE